MSSLNRFCDLLAASAILGDVTKRLRDLSIGSLEDGHMVMSCEACLDIAEGMMISLNRGVRPGDVFSS